MISYGRQWIDGKDIQAVEKVMRTDWLTQGPTIEKFEQSLAQVAGTKSAVAVSNGTAALHAACFAIGIGENDEVIVPTLTFAASANCVLYCGGTLKLCDINLKTLTIDISEVKKQITSKTKAIIAVDFAGHPTQWQELHSLARQHQLKLIDDAAHALGAKYKGKPVGTLADLTTFSFHPVKAITTAEGGAIVTNNQKLYERLKLFRNHGIRKENRKQKTENRNPAWYQEMVDLGYNYRLTDIQAALGLSQLTKLNRFLKRRQVIASRYIKAFSGIPEIILPPHHQWANHAWHIFPLQFRTLDRNDVYEKLREKGVGCQVHYTPIHLQPYYQNRFGYRQGDFPNAEKYYSRCLTIPLFPAMTNEVVKQVIKTIKAIVVV